MKKLTTLFLMGLVCGAVWGQTEYWNGEKNVNSDISRYGNISLNNSGNITGLGENGYVNFHRMKFVGGFQSLGDIGDGYSYYTYLSNGGSHVINGGPYDFNCFNKWVDVTALTLSRSGFSFLSKDCDAVGEVKLNELMRITLSGNVGVGTTKPLSKFHIENGDLRITNDLQEGGDGKASIVFSEIANNPDAHARITYHGDDYGGDSNFIGFALGDNVSKDFSQFVIQRSGNVGVGTIKPNGKLEVRGSINYSLNDQVKTIIHTNGDGNSYFNYIGGGANSWIGFQIDGGSKMSIMNNGNVGIGKLPSNAKLDVAGNIKAHEIEVTLAAMQDLQLNGTLAANNITYTANGNTADFVFEDNYQLKDLSEVEAFIKTNKHLPEIPSAAEMEEAGVNLAEMNKLLLMKVEELTLYAIEQKTEAEKNGAEVERLKVEVEKVSSLELEVEELKKMVMTLIKTPNLP